MVAASGHDSSCIAMRRTSNFMSIETGGGLHVVIVASWHLVVHRGIIFLERLISQPEEAEAYCR